jgi:hypothetical protein
MTLRFRLAQTPRRPGFSAKIPFGQAQLNVGSNGRCKITGGGEADHAEILEWISLCAPHLVPDRLDRTDRSC